MRMLHEASKTTKTLLHNFAASKLGGELQLSVQIPVFGMEKKTKEHAGNERVTCANCTAPSQ